MAPQLEQLREKANTVLQRRESLDHQMGEA